MYYAVYNRGAFKKKEVIYAPLLYSIQYTGSI